MAAFLFFVVAEYGVWIGMLVYAFHHGGATASGLVAMAQLLPGALLSPVLASIADRSSPSTLIVGGYVAQSVAMVGVAAAIWSGASPFVAYGFAVVANTALGAARPAQYALLPAIAHDAQQLTAANVIEGWAETAGMVLGAVLASVLLDLGEIGTLFAICATLTTLGAIVVLPVRVSGIANADEADEEPAGKAMLEGFRVVRSRACPRLLVGLLTTQDVVVGALDVLFVVVAIHLLGKGQGWVGYLNTVYGLGALAGGLLATHLLGRRLRPVMSMAIAAMCAGLVLTAFMHEVAVIVVLLAFVGYGRALLFVSATTLLQRTVPAQSIGRVFGVVEGLSNVGLAAGAVLPPLLIHLGGDRLALVVVGVLLPVTALIGSSAYRRLDQEARVPVVEVALLRSLPHFGALPAPALETLATALERVEAGPGEVIVRQGDRGELFYAIAEGEVMVSIDGRPVGTRGRGTGIGEIALLRDTRRTATVTAVGPVTLFTLDSASFLAAVSGHSPTRRRAEQVAARWTDPEPV